MKEKLKTILLLLTFLSGLSLLLYPSVSDYWNEYHATQALSSYRDATAALSEKRYEELLDAAREYNAELSAGEQKGRLNEEELSRYNSLLKLDQTGIMGYVEIPAIDVELPIYHGSEEAVLQTAVGHLNWSSLPVGGESTHCVLSGHRGLPSARLFTDLDKLSPGDRFMIHVLNTTCTYEVDRIQTVEPDEVEELKIQSGEDLCTLVTCTPYGINTHRLLVRGHRVENAEEAVHIGAEAARVNPFLVLPFTAFPLLLLAFAVLRRIDERNDWDKGALLDEKDQK